MMLNIALAAFAITQNSVDKRQDDDARRKYPPMADYLDVQVKKASTDPALQAAGAAQEAAYLAACLAVKTMFPKP